jgi:hypothetical protein
MLTIGSVYPAGSRPSASRTTPDGLHNRLVYCTKHSFGVDSLDRTIVAFGFLTVELADDCGLVDAESRL